MTLKNQTKESFNAYHRAWYAANREKELKRSANYREKNREACNAAARKHRTGCSKEQYDSLFETQKGKCAICGLPEKLVADHDHTTLVVRGLLCSPCNTGIGLLKDDITILTKAVEYLNASTTI